MGAYRSYAETIDELETLHPGIFGTRSGYSRAMAVTGMAWMAGLLVGPALAGFVAERFGYFEVQCVLGEFLAPGNGFQFLTPGSFNRLALCLDSSLQPQSRSGGEGVYGGRFRRGWVMSSGLTEFGSVGMSRICSLGNVPISRERMGSLVKCWTHSELYQATGKSQNSSSFTPVDHKEVGCQMPFGMRHIQWTVVSFGLMRV